VGVGERGIKEIISLVVISTYST